MRLDFGYFAGDSVISGMATLMLPFASPSVAGVRSAGHAVNTSWNFWALDDAAQLRTAVDRMRVNTAIGFRNLVPVHTLALDMSTVILGSCGMLALRSLSPDGDADRRHTC